MKILVVGGNGFLGKAIFDRLSSEGHFVLKMDRNESALDLPNTILGDLSKPESYLDFLENWKPEVVIQCAWVTSQKIYRDSSKNVDYQIDTVKFAADCIKLGVPHFIGMGTCAEYGNQQEPCRAGVTPMRPSDLYGQKKLETFLSIKKLATGSRTRFTWARVFQPYGLGQDMERLIPWASGMLATGKEIVVQNPLSKLDWISTRDISSAISWTISNPLPVEIDIGTGVGTSVLDLLLIIASILGVNSKLIKVESLKMDGLPQNDLIMSKSSPLLSDGWKPNDMLLNGLRWAIQ